MMKDEQDFLKQSESEAHYFDKLYTETDKSQRFQNYLVPERFINQVLNPNPHTMNDFEYAYSLLGKLENKKLLDYGAGDGWNAICFAKAKAKVWAIDISEKGIDLIRKKAKANNVSEFIIADVQNCYKTQFASNMFDIIYGGGILHHLDIDAAGKEINRILHPNGIAVFYEPIRDTKIMDIIKAIVLRLINRKPSEETENETPMTSKGIWLLKRYFKNVNYRYFNVLTSVSLLIESEKLKSFLTWIDYILMKYIPGFKKLGRAVVIELREPTKNS